MSESSFREGFYAVFMAAHSGEGYAVVAITQGSIVGADPLGVKFDGSYSITGDQLAASVQVTAPPGGTLIQGVETGPAGLTYPVSFSLSSNFETQPFVAIATPLGPVNARFRFLRGMTREQ